MAEAARRRAEDSFLEDVQLDDSEVRLRELGCLIPALITALY